MPFVVSRGEPRYEKLLTPRRVVVLSSRGKALCEEHAGESLVWQTYLGARTCTYEATASDGIAYSVMSCESELPGGQAAEELARIARDVSAIKESIRGSASAAGSASAMHSASPAGSASQAAQDERLSVIRLLTPSQKDSFLQYLAIHYPAAFGEARFGVL